MRNDNKHQKTFDEFFKHVTAIENLWPGVQEVLFSGQPGHVKNLQSECASLLYVIQKIMLSGRDRIK
ncbi:MAG: hypothetical protein IPJ38_02340 [Dechloromonas sp.]|jgi:hypothetical protein|uniref:Uncharacterized protein n=1 Tax=Candidatus Dechloromonas phosphorivorans TaxID=2899244 RepID=A0A935K896_9RHOO|nr:hypothetical protein [Candidatus Dechloromonas phosphorivorans]